MRTAFALLLLFGFAAVPCPAAARESYFDDAWQKSVDPARLRRDADDACRAGETGLAEIDALVREADASGYLWRDALRKRREILVRLLAYIRREAAREIQPEGLLFARHGAQELRQLLDYFGEERRRYDRNAKPAKVFNVRDFGARGDGETDDREAFQRALEAVRGLNGANAIVRIPSGKYRFRTLNPKGLPVMNRMAHQQNCYPTTFHPSHLLLRNLANVTLAGEAGAELLFDHSTYVDGIAIAGCENVTVRNLALDFTQLPFTQAEILAWDPAASALTIRFEAGYPLPGSQPNFKGFLSGTMLYEADGSRWVGEAGIFQPEKLEFLSGRDYRYRLHPSLATAARVREFRPGRRMVMMARYNGHANGVYSCRSKFTTLCDVDIYSSPCAGAIDLIGYAASFIRCRLIPRPGTTRLCSTNADGLASIQCVIGPYIKECVISNIGDDAVTTYNRGAQITSVSPDGGKVKYQFRDRFFKGGELAVVDALTGKIKWESRCADEAANVARMEDPIAVPVRSQENIYDVCLTDDDTLLYFPTREKKRILPDILVCNSLKSVGAVVADCRISSHRGDAIHIESPNAIIENNRIRNIGVFGIAVTGRNLQIEQMVPHNVVVRNNHVEDCLLAIFTSYTHETGGVPYAALRDLLVENNVCGRTPANRPPEFNNVGRLILRGNRTVNDRVPAFRHCEEVEFNGKEVVK